MCNYISAVLFFLLDYKMYSLNVTVFLVCYLFLFIDIAKSDGKDLLFNATYCKDLRRYCGNSIDADDISILECLQTLDPAQLNSISLDCQHLVWNRSKDLISNDYVVKYVNQFCKNDLIKNINCMNNVDKYYLKCIVDNRDNIHTDECLRAIDRLEGIAFQDYRWILPFLKECDADINKLQCGRIDGYGLSQAKTITCLQLNTQNISNLCRKEVFALSELQADNIKLDRQLYVNCKQDHLKYCPQFIAGGGRVFTCLMQQDHTRLSSACVSNLFRRQQLIAQDYKVSKGLMRACREDIKKSHCRKQTSTDKNIRLAQVLLCLENVLKNGSLIDHDCEREMIDHRKMLMEDFRLSPEIVTDCKIEIKSFCSGIERGGKTIHCLMEQARLAKHPKRKISPNCLRALEHLISETDAAEDWRVDPVLHEACAPVVRTLCKDVKGGDARVMSCLLDNMGDDHMLDECENALMQIQYFVSRDFKLDPQLYRACRTHAENVCHASKSWAYEEEGPSYDSQVLPCLYRYAYLEDNKLKLNKQCLQELKRVMRQRAQSVDLQPEIEDHCLDDLSELCANKVKKGEEMVCLQKNMERLSNDCQKAVESFTEVEGRNVELNHYIMSNCRKEMEHFCKYELKKDDGDIMECLISHKNDQVIKDKPACRASIEHFQLISLKNYKYTYKFKVACKKHAIRWCPNAKNFTEVITCLSERITNDTIKQEKSVIPKDCRQQIKAQLFQQRESIDLNPKLKAACFSDIQTYCPNVEHGNAQVLECLQSIHSKLSEKCEEEIFKVKKQESVDNSLDYALMTMCADSINMFCPNHNKDDVLECLKRNKDERGFNKKCKTIVLHRLIEQNTHYELNPSLQENCKADMKKFCTNLSTVVIKKIKGHITGPIINCLKNAFRHSRLSDRCEKEMAQILRDQALDINLNPLLKAVCKNEVETICRSDENGNVEECLKKALINKKIPTPQCQIEVANMIEESQADIQVDPLLQQVCSIDLLKFCNEIAQGNGRHIRCLQATPPERLSMECRDMLTKRLEMYRNAEQYAPPENLNQLYYQVVASPSRHYFFLVIFMMIGSIFVIGMFCGRVSRRHMLVKNK